MVIAWLLNGLGACGQAPSEEVVSRPTPREFAEPTLELPVDEGRFLDELVGAEWRELCAWMIEVQGGPQEVDCGEGVSIRVDTVEECSAREEFPHCPVELLAACVGAQAEDLCGPAPAECDTFYACVYGESP